MNPSVNIIKIGGKVIEEPETLQSFLTGFSQLNGPKILVHGGGRTATELANKLGIASQMVEGRRITDASTLEVVTMVYGGLVNKNIVAVLQSLGCNALGLTGADLNCILAEKRNASPIDYGFVGDVVAVNAIAFVQLLKQGITPVLAPLTHNKSGQLLNTNADTIAARVAIALSKSFDVALSYCFEKKGVLQNINDDNSVIALIKENNFMEMKADGSIADGMIPKLDNAFATLKAGVEKVHIMHHTAITNLGTSAFTGTTLCL
jgi:acetylglutamate kinase